MSAPTTAPLVITCDDALRDALLRLAAAAGTTPAVLLDPADALIAWAAAPLVLVGADVAAAVAALAPPRRDRVHVITHGHPPDDVFRVALALGAEGVVDLTGAQSWLVETLTDVGSAHARGLVIGVVGGSGGAGATTLACALGQVAAERGEVVVVDCDPFGPGVDRVLGLEATDGVRWDALCQTTGRLGATALREALPRRDRLGALSWRPGPSGTLQAFAVRETLSAACRGHDVVVLDLPRRSDPVLDEVVARCGVLLVVVVPTVLGVASAARLVACHRERTAPQLVLRGPGADEMTVAQAVGAPVLTTMGEQRGIDEAVDLGLGPLRSRRGTLSRACRAVLAHPALEAA